MGQSMRGRGFPIAVAGFAAACLLAAALPRRASAERVHPDFPAAVVIGAPSGAQPMMRGDVERSGRTLRLPDRARELWHRKIRGGLSLPAVVDAQGSIVIAAAVAEVVQVSPEGNEQWHHTLGMSVATAGPVILSDGTRVVLTALGDIWGFKPDGSVRFQADLSRFGADPRVAPLPLDNGHVVVAIAAHLIELDAGGTVADHTEVPERLVGMLVKAGDAIAATGDGGKVYLWNRPLSPRAIGTFGGLVRDGVVLARAGTLAAVVDNARLVEMSIATGATATLANLVGMEGPPTLTGKATLTVSGTAGVLLGMTGPEETMRVSLNPAPVVDPNDPDAGPAPMQFTSPSPALIADREGRIAFVRSDGRVGIVSPSGSVAALENPACGNPLSLVPAGDQKFLVACRNGSLKLYGP